MKKVSKAVVKELVVKAINDVYDSLDDYSDIDIMHIIEEQREEVLRLITFIEAQDGSILFSFDGLLYESFNYCVFEELAQSIEDTLDKAGYYYEMENPSTLYIYKN